MYCKLKYTVNVLKLFFWSIIHFGYMARLNKMFVRIANREDPDQTGSALFLNALFAGT